MKLPLTAFLILFRVLAPTPEQDKTIKQLEDTLMAPCCYSQTIRVHMSAEAEQMREEVTDMVLAGKSKAQIINFYRAKYGETILVVPDGTAGRFAFGVPAGVLLAASCMFTFWIARLKQTSSNAEATSHTVGVNKMDTDIIARIRKDVEGEM